MKNETLQLGYTIAGNYHPVAKQLCREAKTLGEAIIRAEATLRHVTGVLAVQIWQNGQLVKELSR